MEDAALQTCRNRLTAKGIDLSQYNTINDAADIADLRIALHLQSMDLYGVSYGTRVAEAVMRYFPTGIRSVVLDSIVTPQFNIYVDPITAEARAFDQLLTGCAQAPKCHKKHPHLTTTFHHLLGYLNKHPLTFKTKVSGSKKAYTVKLNGSGFAEFVRSSMYVTPLIPVLPAIIAKVAKGIGLKFGSVYNHATAATTTDSMGVYESVTCSEDAPTATPAAIRAAAQSLPKPIRAYTITETLGQLAMCKIWNVTPQAAPPAPTPSATIPTLLLEGQYDPITPPANLATMQSLLPQSYGYVFPYSGHGVYLTSLCSQKVINSFYDNPTTTPDADCVAKLTGPFA
jgi:pimeloyl-ACP methyl ester carboxylesterase